MQTNPNYNAPRATFVLSTPSPPTDLDVKKKTPCLLVEASLSVYLSRGSCETVQSGGRFDECVCREAIFGYTSMGLSLMDGGGAIYLLSEIPVECLISFAGLYSSGSIYTDG